MAQVVYITEDQAIDRIADILVEIEALKIKRDELNKRIREKRKEINLLASALDNVNVKDFT